MKRLGWGMLILAVLVAIGMPWNRSRIASKLQQTLAELDRTEPGWRFEEVESARPQVPDQENSAHVVVSAARNLRRSWPPQDLAEDRFRSLSPNEMLKGEDFVLLVSELASVRSASEISARLTDRPRGRHRPFYTPDSLFPKLPRDQLNSRRIVTLLVYESMRWNQEGESNTALMACRAALNAARSIGDEPFQFSQLLRSGGIDHACWAIERTLGQGEPLPADLAALQKQLEDEDAFADQLTAVRGERASGQRMFEGVERGDVSVDDLTAKRMDRLERTVSALWNMDTREDHALFLSLITRRIKEVQRPMHEQAALENEFEREVRALPTRAFLTRWLLSADSTVLAGQTLGAKSRRKHASLRCTIVALAAERFRREKKDWPDNIDQFCPQYLVAAPLDPFDGKPLRYRRAKHGVVIYCVGQNGVDNGGNLDREHSNQPGLDFGFRLWDVSKRRQPPKPRNEE